MTYKHLCCLSNASMPGIVKVCMTEKEDPNAILLEANVYDTWVPEPYKLEFSKRVSKADERYKTLTSLLEKHAIPRNPLNGFYRISLEEMSKFFKILDGKRCCYLEEYNRFRKERIRQPVTMEEKMQFKEEPMLMNKLKTIIWAWNKELGMDLNSQEAINLLTEEFGEPVNGKEWHTIKVFGSDDAVADWDAAHVLMTSGKIKVFTITDDHPSANENVTP